MSDPIALLIAPDATAPLQDELADALIAEGWRVARAGPDGAASALGEGPKCLVLTHGAPTTEGALAWSGGPAATQRAIDITRAFAAQLPPPSEEFERPGAPLGALEKRPAGSALWVTPAPMRPDAATTDAAIAAETAAAALRGLALELAPGCRLNAVSARFAAAPSSDDRDELRRAARFLIASTILTGQTIALDFD